MQKCKKTDFSNVHVYLAEFIYDNKSLTFYQFFATSIKDARERAKILKKFIFSGVIPLSKVRTIVFMRKY